MVTRSIDPAHAHRGRISPVVSPFEDFYRSNYASTKRLAHLLTGSTARAEDLTHEAFAALYPRFEALERPAAYLRTTTVNLCRRWQRRHIGERDRFALLATDDIVLPSETAELLGAVGSLPFRQQVVLVLRYWARLSETEIATTLNCPPGTVKSLHHRAIATLRKDLS